VDDWGEQTLLGVNSETEVLGVVVGDLPGVLVVAGVDVGMDPRSYLTMLSLIATTA
jgi:hypothetical protein